ncbi:MAG: hypothetical protein Q8O56_08620 [Solirubrobacteraceae bacterium]|nr:hypothetical protein [Solirubrobacteraceae bacterium]
MTVSALVLGPAAIAEAPAPPVGNFGGGALVAPPKDLFGPGNAIVGLRALDNRRLEIEATVRGKCAGGDITARTQLKADSRFSVKGSGTQEPSRGVKVRTTYTMSGAFTGPRAAEGKLSATLRRTAEGRTTTCRTGSISFSARRPEGTIGRRGAAPRARYFGVTAQRGVGPRRPIVLRISGDGRRISYALFGQQVRCSDGTRSIGLEAPRTNIRIDGNGRVSDRDRDEIDDDATRTNVDDRFEATIGRDGAKGTFSLSDRTIDKLTGNVIRSCRSGKIAWTAAP